MKRISKILIFIILIAGFITAVFFVTGKYSFSRLAAEKAKITEEIQQKAALDDLNGTASPSPADSQTAPETPVNDQSSQTPNANNIPTKKLFAMPFYSQTPLGNWDAIHENTCEEASVLNAGLYLIGKKLSSADFDSEMMKIIDIEKKLSINFTDSTIAETKQFSDAYFPDTIKSKIIDNPTIQQIEAEIASGHPVIVPLAGREIGNPNYTPPGPLYHMLVIKGYDEQFFITNDVGTRKGDSYVYKKDVLMQNTHDWNATDIHLGAKRVLVLYK